MENTDGTVGIAGIDEEDDFTVVVCDGGIEVCSVSPSNVAVYDVTGRKVAETVVEGSCTFTLPGGVYVVGNKCLLVK